MPIGYVRTFGKVINNARLDFNRSRISTQNLYAFNQDITGTLGITGVSTNPFDWGLPNLSFTHFGSLNDINPQLLRNQTWTFSDNLIYRRGKHTWRWGGDFRRIRSQPPDRQQRPRNFHLYRLEQRLRLCRFPAGASSADFGAVRQQQLPFSRQFLGPVRAG